MRTQFLPTPVLPSINNLRGRQCRLNLETLGVSCHADWNTSCHTLNVCTTFICQRHKSSFSDRLNEFHLPSYRRDCQHTRRDFKSFAISAKSIYPIKDSCSWNVVCLQCQTGIVNGVESLTGHGFCKECLDENIKTAKSVCKEAGCGSCRAPIGDHEPWHPIFATSLNTQWRKELTTLWVV